MAHSNKHTIPIRKIVRQALREDAAYNDITTKLLISKDKRSKASIKFNEAGIICGLQFAKIAFKILNNGVKFRSSYKDGARVRKNTTVATVEGNARALLSAERVALNFLGYLSGIATKTHAFVQKVHPLKVRILDTRKTTPGLRPLEKYAVRCGGGVNHRDSLRDMTLIKDNHKAVRKTNNSLKEVVQRVRKANKKPIQIEVDNLREFKAALPAEPDFILLDNMNPTQMKKAVSLNKSQKKQIYLEASGGININNVRKIAQTGVDRISIGELTHSAKNIDVSMEIRH